VQGSIAQIIAVTLYGNAFLQGRRVDAFWPQASIFQFCSAVVFRSTDPPREWTDPPSWFANLQGSITGLRLHLADRNGPGISDRAGTGFVGGGSRWIIEAVGASANSLWESTWDLGDTNAPNQKIWRVTYDCIATKWTAASPPSRSLEDVRGDLASALDDIARFAQRNNLGFTEYFLQGRAALNAKDPFTHAYHHDLSPPGLLSLEALQILGSCQAAWVFGGMGSWNDGAYGGNLTAEGDRLSERLFKCLQEALVAAANSSFVSRPT
jgi:hypothetical protein